MSGWLLYWNRRRYARRLITPAIEATERAICEARRQYVAGFTPP